MKNYIGKTVECLCTGAEVYIHPSFCIESSSPYINETWAYNDEGEAIALLFDGKNHAKII